MRAQDSLYEILRQNRYCVQYVCVHEQSSEWYEHFTPMGDDAKELKIYVGDLQGLNKDWYSQHYGAEQVHLWQRSYEIPPPNGESLQMTAARTLTYYQERIVPHRRGESVLISAHGSSLRAIIMHVEHMTPQQIIDDELATAVPHRYTFDDDVRLIDKHKIFNLGKES